MESTMPSPEVESRESPCDGEEVNDTLLPLPEDECRTLHNGQHTWRLFLQEARDQARGSWRTDLLNPYIVLNNVPALPQSIPDVEVLKGRAFWQNTLLQLDDGGANDPPRHKYWEPELTYGNEVLFFLRIDKPIVCAISDDAPSLLLDTDNHVTGSLAVLTLCWAYILSARLLENQHLPMRYTFHRITPTLATARERSRASGEYKLHIGAASPALVRWLCSLLAPELGWDCDGELFLPWAALLDKAFAIGITTSTPPEHLVHEGEAPSSTEAVELLLEFCEMFGLSSGVSGSPDSHFLSPCNTAFLAALMIPFYGADNLIPCLPPPRLEAKNIGFDDDDKRHVRQYLADAGYFMTLSLTHVFPACMLSVFWQPDVACNLVSPWLTSIYRTLRSSIESKDIETLVKTFLARRPRCGIWWFALFMLGDRSIIDWIPRYFIEPEERWGYASLARPNLLAEPWTGTRVSFLDSPMSRSYMIGPVEDVSRADWLRCRIDFKLQDSACTPVTWLPSGTVDKEDIEPELWPGLERKHKRRYLFFTWFKKYGPEGKAHSVGFRRDTKRAVAHVPDDLDMRESPAPCPGDCLRDVPELPSKTAIRRLADCLVESAKYERCWGNAVLPGNLADYRWLEEWEGLRTFDRCNVESPAKKGEKWRVAVTAWLEELSLVPQDEMDNREASDIDSSGESSIVD